MVGIFRGIRKRLRAIRANAGFFRPSNTIMVSGNDLAPKSSTAIRVAGVLGLLIFVAGFFLVRTEFKLTSEGEVRRAKEREVVAPSDGHIEAVRFSDGESVSAGEVVMRMAAPDARLELLAGRQSMAELEAALLRNEIARKRAKVRPAPAEVLTAPERDRILGRIQSLQEELVGRLETLESSGGISATALQEHRIDKLRVELERLAAATRANWMEAGLPELDREALEAERKRLEAERPVLRERLALLEEKAGRAEVRAPIGGTLTRVRSLRSGAEVGRGELLFRVVDTETPFLVRAEVPEKNIDLVRPGVPVRMESGVFNALAEGYVRGRVVSVSPDAEPGGPGADAPVYDVDIEVVRSPLPLVLGSRMEVEILLGERSLLEMLFMRRKTQDEMRSGAGEETPS